MSAAQQQVIRTAQRQLRISNEYAKATGNKGKPKTKEGKNIFRNFGDVVMKMLTNFCTSDKSKDDAKNSSNTEKLAAIGKKQMAAYGIYEKPDGSGFTLDSGTVSENMVNNFVGGSVLSYAGIKSQQGKIGKKPGSSNNTVSKNSTKKASEASSKIDKITPRRLTEAENKTYKRPSGYRKDVRDEVWDNAKGSDGIVRDPLTQRPLNADEPWDMGHKPGDEFKKHQQSAADREIPRNQFLDEHNDPSHYRPELPSSNRGHTGEDVTNKYFSP